MKSTPPDALGRLLAARPLVDLADALRQNESVLVSGLWGSSVAAVVTAVAAGTQKPFLLVCGHLDEADDLADDIELFSGTRPDVLPALELAGSLGRASEEQVSNRLQLLARLALAEGKGERGQGSTKAGLPRSSDLLTPDRSALSPTRIVAPIQALMQSVPSKSQLVELIFTISKSQKIEPEKLIVWLAEHGYNRLDQVEVPGDFAVRGGIVDIYLPGDHAKSDDPNAEHTIGLSIRVDFFDDQIESIKRFNLDTLGSAGSLDSARILDLKGLLPDTKDSTSILSYLPADTLVAFWAPLEIAEQAKSYIDRLPETRGIYPLASILSNVQPFTRLELSQFDQGGTSLIGSNTTPHIKLPVETLQRFETEAKKAINELAEFSATHEITIFCENDGEKERFTELLETHEKGLSSKVSVGLGYLHRGFIWSSENDESGTQNDERKSTSSFNAPRSSLAFLGHHELFHRYEVRRRVKKIVASRPVDSFMDLKVGDYVVHVSHGIAKFTGIQTINKEGRSEEYLTLRFADDAALHVPVSRIGLIQRYVGGFTGHPTLSRLGSGVWEKQKAKVSEAVMDMAAELLEVQAARAGQPGIPYPPDTEWQREFEAEFPYQPTDDQVTGATEIKLDMQKPRPMDRLLCGDVGYGKTELAMRAAFECVEYGKQVAILVPTTVLAEQHYRSFKERMANYPFNVDVISRFKSGKEQKETVAKLKKGEVDVVIGTHRLLSKDVDFADLGLVVIDEEQRFGVTHKERFKQMRKTVDVLTMSATPIPRTLHMSMLGLRDISSLTTAPQD